MRRIGNVKTDYQTEDKASNFPCAEVEVGSAPSPQAELSERSDHESDIVRFEHIRPGCRPSV
jgi:hypothetical protein